MGKIRTRVIGDEETEKKQKKEQKERAERKKVERILAENPELEGNDTIPGEKKTEEVEGEAKPATPVKEKATKKPKKVLGKNHKGALKKLDRTVDYSVVEAIEALKKAAYAKFPESVELHLNVVKEGLKGEIELPHSTGKKVRVAIVDDALLEQLEKGVIEFDMLITHPSFMPKIAKYARVLGPRGLMPNPKAGTVSTTPDVVAKKFEKGTLRWKAESKFPLIHQMVAKLTLDTKAIAENVNAFIETVGRKNIKEAYIKSTMSPALKLKLEAIE